MSLTLTDEFKQKIYNQNFSPIFKVEILSIDDGSGNTVTADITEFITNIGNVSRRAGFGIGRMSPTSHSFEIKDTKRLNQFLFTLRSNFGTDVWMDKEIVINIGFKKTFVSGSDNDFVEIYRGKIDTKIENRINGIIQVSSKDVIKDLTDFKVCTLLDSDDVFEYNLSTITDERSFQQVLKYGKHQLITNDGDAGPLSDRNNPFTATIGFPNIATSGRPKGATNELFLGKFNWWYFPFHNTPNSASSLYTDGTLRAYYWDYIDLVWRPFLTSEFTSRMTLHQFSGINGMYLSLTDLNNITLDGGTTWEDYILADNGKWSTDTDKFDPSICIEHQSNVVGNPIRIVHDLFTASRFLNQSATILDFLDFDTSNTSRFDFTFDKVFDFFEEDIARQNTAFLKETSIMDVLNEVSRSGGFSIFGGAKKDKTADGGGTDHRVKIIDVSPINDDPDCGGTVITNLEYSTADRINNFKVKTASSLIKNKVTATNFDPAKSTRDNFDVKSKSRALVGNEVEKVIQFGADRNPLVYWYDSGAFVQALVDRYFNLFTTSFEEYEIKLDKSGLEAEAGDIIKIHDEISDLTRTIQIIDTNNDLKNFSTNIKGRRFPQQFGPDEDEPLKLWAFVDCAFVSTTGDVPPNGGGPNGETYHCF